VLVVTLALRWRSALVIRGSWKAPRGSGAGIGGQPGRGGRELVRASRNVSNLRRTPGGAWQELAAFQDAHSGAWDRAGAFFAAQRDADSDDDGQACKTCSGTGRLRHPRTGKPSVKCPSCGGSGVAPEDGDGGDGASASARGRHIRFERGGVRVINRGSGMPLGVAPAEDGPAPAGAQLDRHPWARTWGSFLAAIADKSDRAGARATCRKVMDATRLLNAALSERVPAEGGYLLPERLRSQVLAYMMGSIVRPRCSLLPLDSERVPVPTLENPSQASGAQALGGMTWSFTQEGAAIPATVPNFGRVALEAWPDKALLKDVPNELISDSPAFTEDFLPRVVGLGLAWHVDDYALYQGTGVGQPQALVNAPGQVQVTRNPPSGYTIGHIDVVTCLKSLHPASKTTATWLVSEDAFDQLLEVYEIAGSAPSGQLLSPPNVLKFKGGMWTLFGLPVIPNDHQPQAGTPGDLMLCDLSLLLLGEREAMTVEVAPHAGFGKDTSYIRFRYRWDARFWPQSTITLANGKVTSPLVVLH
jgi:HK97 family phage major capsid protein